MKTTDFPSMLSDFLLKELPNIRNQSSNTIISYRDTYVRLLIYCRDVLSIKPERISVTDLTAERLVDYLNWLEQDCNNSINTRNQRLAAIHSLFRYIQMQSPEYLFQCQQILGIPYKKAEKHPVGYLSEDETKTLLSTPDTSTRKGRRDQALLTLLYDSGARVQELVDLRVGDLRLNTPAQVKLTGKGRKTRCVPLMDKTVALLRQYLLENNIDTPVSFEHPLFFNSQRKKLTRQGVAYILCKYADLCNIQQVSPHKLRHTKAMHLTEADVNPIFIRDFLGHTDLKVTEIYSKTSIKMKKAALDKMNSGKTVIPDKPVKDWTNDNSLLDWLNGLKR
jgi:site-specific recombinase XerD